ncbi:MAG: hypothetical protein ACK5Z5_05970 [Neisseriaceae bacterium]
MNLSNPQIPKVPARPSSKPVSQFPTATKLFEVDEIIDKSVILQNREIMDCNTEENLATFITKIKTILSSTLLPVKQLSLGYIIQILTKNLSSGQSSKCECTYYGLKKCLENISSGTNTKFDDNDMKIIIRMCIEPNATIDMTNFTDMAKEVFEKLGLKVDLSNKYTLIYDNIENMLKHKTTDLFQLPPSSITTGSTSTTSTISTSSTTISTQSSSSVGRTPPIRPSHAPKIIYEISLPDFTNTSLEHIEKICRKDIINSKDILVNPNEEIDKFNRDSDIVNFCKKCRESNGLNKETFKFLIDILINVLNPQKRTKNTIAYYGIKVFLYSIVGIKEVTNDDINLLLGICINRPSLIKYNVDIIEIFKALEIRHEGIPNKMEDIPQTMHINARMFRASDESDKPILDLDSDTKQYSTSKIFACKNLLVAKDLFIGNRTNFRVKLFSADTESIGIDSSGDKLYRKTVKELLDKAFIKLYKDKFIQKFSTLLSDKENVGKFMLLVNILTKTFCCKKISPDIVTFKGIKSYLSFIFSKNDIEIIDDDVKFLVNMCTSQFAYLESRLIQYTDLVKKVCKRLNIKLSDYNVSDVSKISSNDHIFQILQGDNVKLNFSFDQRTLYDIFELVMDRQYSKALNTLHRIINKTTIYEQEQKWFQIIEKIISLVIVIVDGTIDSRTKALIQLKEVINDLTGNDQKQILQLLYNYFPSVWLRVVRYNSKKVESVLINSDYQEIIAETIFIFNGTDLVNIDLSGLNIKLDNFNTISSLNGCIVDENTRIEITNGPVLTGKIDNQLTQLITWWKCQKKVILSANSPLKELLLKSIKELLKKTLSEILESHIGFISLADLNKKFGPIIVQFEFEKITDASDKRDFCIDDLERNHAFKLYDQSILVLKLINESKKNEALEKIKEIIISCINKYDINQTKFLQYCQTHYPSEYLNAMVKLDAGDRAKVNKTALKQILFIEGMQFKDIDFSSLCLVNVPLEKISSLANCVVDSKTIIKLVSPFNNNAVNVARETVKDWISKCLDIIDTATNQELKNILYKDLYNLLENMKYTGIISEDDFRSLLESFSRLDLRVLDHK